MYLFKIKKNSFMNLSIFIYLFKNIYFFFISLFLFSIESQMFPKKLMSTTTTKNIKGKNCVEHHMEPTVAILWKNWQKLSDGS